MLLKSTFIQVYSNKLQKIAVQSFLLLISLICCFESEAQLETQNWYFGNTAGITFATNPPTAVLNGVLNTSEGCSTISDASGNLIFYTDGMKVYNNQHLQMPNGFGLLGNPSSAQSGVIVPKPGSSTRFYIFTVAAQGGADGFRYSEVDMTLDNGLGDVIAATKNTLLFAPSVEKVAAVSHANGLYYWVIAHGLNNNRYYAYLVDCSGVNAPVTSDVGEVEGVPGWGCLAASSDGSRLATAMCSKGFEVLDFNNSTGVVSNPILLLNPGNAYGISFSPNNNVLYACKISNGQLYQWDLTAGSPAAIIASMQQIGIGQGTGTYKGGAIQQGLDGKLYMPHFNQPYLSCINDPNSLGAACNLQHFAVDLLGRNAVLGLPPFVQSFFAPPTAIIPTQTCQDVTFTYSNSSSFVDSVQWNFGDAQSGANNVSNLANPTHTYPNPGAYTVSLITYLQCTSDTTTLVFNYVNSDVTTSEVVTQCDSYAWNGQTYTTSGTYQFFGTTVLGCDSIATLNLTIHPSNGSEESINACDDYNWNGQTYATSGTYTFLTQNTNGCDSLLTLNLAINSSFNTVLNETICDGEVLTVNGTDYASAGSYPILLQSQEGCDSTVVLELTVLPVPDAPVIQYTVPECPGDQVDIWVAAGPDSIGWLGPNGFSSVAYSNSISVQPEQTGTYFAWLHANGCYSDTSAQDIQIAYVFDLNSLQMPNIITPNGDGINDTYDLTSLFQNCVDFDLVIINRWGQPVYSGNQDSPFFDGTSGGLALETGVYFYKLRLLDTERSGFVQVSR